METKISIQSEGCIEAYYVKYYNHYCGYVVLHESHPLCKLYNPNHSTFDFAYNSGVTEPHGGITYAERNKYNRLVLGFDLAHYGDDKSGINDSPAYVIAETRRFADELARVYRKHKEENKELDELQSKIDHIEEELIELHKASHNLHTRIEYKIDSLSQLIKTFKTIKQNES